MLFLVPHAQYRRHEAHRRIHQGSFRFGTFELHNHRYFFILTCTASASSLSYHIVSIVKSVYTISCVVILEAGEGLGPRHETVVLITII